MVKKACDCGHCFACQVAQVLSRFPDSEEMIDVNDELTPEQAKALRRMEAEGLLNWWRVLWFMRDARKKGIVEVKLRWIGERTLEMVCSSSDGELIQMLNC